MFQESVFQNRKDAGQQLAQKLSIYRDRSNVLVVGIPKGGMEVASEIARVLNTRLDLWMVHRLGIPGHEDLAVGALAEGGFYILNHDAVNAMGIPAEEMNEIVQKAQQDLKREVKNYRQNAAPAVIKNRVVILADDGLAGSTAVHAAILALKGQGAQDVVAAIPVASQEAVRKMSQLADKVYTLLTPVRVESAAAWYRDLPPASDEQVMCLLHPEPKAA